MNYTNEHWLFLKIGFYWLIKILNNRLYSLLINFTPFQWAKLMIIYEKSLIYNKYAKKIDRNRHFNRNKTFVRFSFYTYAFNRWKSCRYWLFVWFFFTDKLFISIYDLIKDHGSSYLLATIRKNSMWNYLLIGKSSIPLFFTG